MSFPEISALEALDELDRYRVIDVREDYEFNGPLGFVESAELVPLSTMVENAETLAGAAPLLLVCRSGKRSGKACQLLEELGFQGVTNLSGGMIGWNRAGLPVSYSEPRTLRALVDQVVAWVAQVGPLTTAAAYDIVRDRFGRQNITYDTPSHAAVEELISFIAESLEEVNPPDLDLSVASFRRSLAVL